MNEAGRDEGIHEPVQLERTNAICVHLAGFIADYNDLQAIPSLKAGNKLNHPGAWLRLRKDEISKLAPREWPLLIEDHPAQILLEGHPSLFMRLEDQSV